MSDTPLSCVLKVLILQLKDSAEALVARLSKKLIISVSLSLKVAAMTLKASKQIPFGQSSVCERSSRSIRIDHSELVC